MHDSKPAIARAPKYDEVHRAAEVAQLAFETESIQTWLSSFSWIADNEGLDHLVVTEAQEEIVAALVCTPGTCYITNDLVPFSAVGSVATHPDHRMHGYAGMIMTKSVQVLYEKAYHTSALWPFSYNYYRKFGWELGGEIRSYTMPSEFAASLTDPSGTRPATRDDLPAINALFDQMARNYTCCCVRNERWWGFKIAVHDLKLDGTDDPRTSLPVMVHETDGKIDGYVMFNISGEGENESIKGRELIAENPQARRSILAALAGFGAPVVKFFAPINDGFLQELPNPRAVRVDIEPGFQFRVVNPSAALEMRSVDTSISGKLGFTITDPVLDTFDFDTEVSEGRITKVNSRAKERLYMDIQTFAQLYSGYVRPVRAYELGRIQPTSKEAIEFAEKVFPKAIPFRPLVEVG
ncbi:MAG TPA: GNAT family N-acetyltransferase [Armatimonadota bacterium]|nr:GNAT family N-acetyltransferase [Armatimonadota bacterium]